MTKTTKTILWIIIILIIIGGIWYGVSKKSVVTEKEPIKIGAILPLSGSAADYGKEALEGINLALNEDQIINNKNVLLFVEDSKNDTKEGITAFRKLLDVNEINFLLGSMSSVGLAVKSDIGKGGIPTIWIGAHPDLTKDTSLVFKNMATTDQYIKSVIKVIDNKNFKKVGVFYINDDFGVSVKDSFVDNFGGEITNLEAYNKEGKDFRTEITKLLSKKPETIFIAGYGIATGILIKQLRENNYEQDIFGTTEISSTNTQNAAGEFINGVIFPDYSSSQSFKEKCLSSLQKDPTPDIIVGYTGMKVLLEAIKKTDGSSQQVKDYISHLKDFDIINGTVNVIDNEIQFPLVMMEFENNTKILYSEP